MVDTSRYSSYRFVIAGLTLWAHLAAGISFQAVSPVLPLISEDYNINHTTAGLLVAVVTAMVGAFGIAGGVVVGRLGLRLVYAASFFMMGSLSLTALSPSFEGLVALRVVYGLGVAVMIPATGPLIMGWFRPKELPVITSLNLAAMSVGIFVSTSTVAPISSVLDWPTTIGIFGSVGLTGGLGWLLWGRVLQGTRPSYSPLVWSELWAVLKNRTVLLLGIADAACFSQYVALSGWLPTFYSETRDMSLTQAGFLMSLLPLTGIIAVLLGGYLSLKIRSRRVFFIVPGAMAALGGLGTFMIDNTAVTYVSLVFVGLGSWLYVPILLVLPIELEDMTPERVAISWGWIMTASGLGAFVFPLMVGSLRDSFDTFIPGFLVVASLAWLLTFIGFILPKPRTQQVHVSGAPASTDRQPC